MFTRRVFLSTLLAASLSRPAAAREADTAPAARDDGWPVATPSAAGLDPDALGVLTEAIDLGVSFPDVHALVVEHERRLVFEYYKPGLDRDLSRGSLAHVQHGPATLHDIRSISKSVTSLLLGAALGASAEDAVQRPIVSFFPEREDLRDQLEAITLHQVLTMTAGLAWNEAIVPYHSDRNDFSGFIGVSDPVGFVLGKELSETPGTLWKYNSGLTDLAGVVIENLTGKPLKEYADEVLFGPLGITDYEWWRPAAWGPDSFPSASAGLRMRARDLAKISSLILANGRWQGRQIAPEAWVKASTTRHIDTPWFPYGYGYFWYPGSLTSGQKVIAAFGSGGQRILVLPDEKLAITIFAGNYRGGGDALGERIAGRIVRAMR